jgi:GTP cyclohydrolase II
MILQLTGVLEAVRRGETVRVVSSGEARGDGSGNGAGHLVLAAERASIKTLARWLPAIEGTPVFATTRDRLEQLRIAGAPFFDDEEGTERALGDRGWPSGVMPAAARLAQASAYLTGSRAGRGRDSLRDLTVRCTDWGGVVNCQRVFEAAVDLSRLAGLAPVALIGRARADRRPDDSWGCEQPAAAPTVSIRQVVDHRRGRVQAALLRNGPCVRMPTRHGNFSLQGYEDTLTGQLHLALWTGELRDPTLVRVHSECLTGDLLGSLRCDCGPQLDRALARLVQEGRGVLLYLRQEGRGIGLINKLRTYAIQDQGFDTIEANERIGFEADLRDYSLAAQMLVDLGVSTIRLLTNNPQKVRGLKKHGIQVINRVPLVVEPCSENAAYLDVKRTKMGHWLT